MDSRTIISWNLVNWITVVLMVSLGYFLAAIVGKYAFGAANGQ